MNFGWRSVFNTFFHFSICWERPCDIRDEPGLTSDSLLSVAVHPQNVEAEFEGHKEDRNEMGEHSNIR
jgi:hypothetical protein